jgi:hypothetical protein
MARSILLVSFLILLTTAASGVSDPRTDVLGLYFDANADLTCRDDGLIAVPFSVYLIYTNPSVDAIRGFEAGFHVTGDFILLSAQWPCGIIWVVDPELDNLYVACAEPIPVGVATPLVRFDLMSLAAGPIEGTFLMDKASGSVQPGDNPHIILPDDSLMEVNAGHPAYILYDCGVPVESTEWGSIKSNYR